MKKILFLLLLPLLISCTIIQPNMPKSTSTVGKIIYSLASNAAKWKMIKDEIFNNQSEVLEMQFDYTPPYPYEPEIIYEHEDFNISIIKNKKNKGKENSDRNILYVINGGAFYHTLRNSHKDFYINIINHVKNNDFDVVFIKYTSLYYKNFPYQLTEIKKAYDYLIKEGYKEENFVMIGDSAGGNLILSFNLWLRDNNRKMPRLLITLSPWTDLTNTTESRNYNRYRDIVMGTSSYLDYEDYPDALIHNEYGIGYDLKNPYISPIYGDYHGFPATIIEVGSYEMLFDDSYKVYKNMLKNKVKVYFHDTPGMFHVFQVVSQLEETKQSKQRIARIIEEIFKK